MPRGEEASEVAMTMEEQRNRAIATEAAGGLERPPEANGSPPPAESKFTEKNRHAILGAVAGGSPLDLAAALAGVRKSTVTDWIYRGMNDEDAGVQSDYAKFAVEIHQALAMPIAEAVKTVTAAVKRGDVQTSRWLLERRASESFGKTDKVQVTGDPNAPVVIELSWPTGGMPDPEQRAIDAQSEEIVDAVIVDDGTEH